MHIPVSTKRLSCRAAFGGAGAKSNVVAWQKLFDRDPRRRAGTAFFERRLYLPGDGAVDLGVFALRHQGTTVSFDIPQIAIDAGLIIALLD
jgi:hypothetical protein